MDIHLIYLNDKPKAVTVAKDVEGAVTAFRQAALLGRVDLTDTVITAKLGWDAPFEDFVRTCFNVLFSQMFQTDLAMQAASAAAAARAGKPGKKH